MKVIIVVGITNSSDINDNSNNNNRHLDLGFVGTLMSELTK